MSDDKRLEPPSEFKVEKIALECGVSEDNVERVLNYLLARRLTAPGVYFTRIPIQRRMRMVPE